MQTNPIKTDLSRFNNTWFQPGRNISVRAVWYLISRLMFVSGILPSSGILKFLLRLFGAKIGKWVVIKPGVNIKYPWNLNVGNYSWIGENVWIDNLVKVQIGEHVCISQGAFILTGNHNYKKSTFELIAKEIILEDGVWIGANSVVCPGVKVCSHAVLTVGSIATKDIEAYSIYAGNPAVKMRERVIEK